MATEAEYIEYRTELKLRLHATELSMLFRNLGAENVLYHVETVELMSRAFADQLHKEIETLKSEGISVFVIGSNAQPESVLQAVANTQHALSRETGNYVLRSFTKDNIDDFFAILDGKMAY
ncbi:MAG: hypothetical protein V4543_13985 [Bacteroidota bacterium]